MRIDSKKLIIVLSLVLVAAISAFLVADWASSIETHSGQIAKIDEKIDTVLKLTSTSTLSSVAVSAIPGDTATPIAEKLADFTEYFLFILCVLYAEKYLLTILGLGAFRVIIPLACAAFITALFWNPGVMKRLGMKLAIFGIAIYVAIPLSLGVSDMVYKTYEESIATTIQAAEDLSDETSDLAESTDENWIKNVMNSLSETVDSLTTKAASILRRFVETMAVLIVTSCVIPLLVIVFFAWIIRMFTGANLTPYLNKFPRRKRKSKTPPMEL